MPVSYRPKMKTPLHLCSAKTKCRIFRKTLNRSLIVFCGLLPILDLASMKALASFQIDAHRTIGYMVRGISKNRAASSSEGVHVAQKLFVGTCLVSSNPGAEDWPEIGVRKNLYLRDRIFKRDSQVNEARIRPAFLCVLKGHFACKGHFHSRSTEKASLSRTLLR